MYNFLYCVNCYFQLYISGKMMKVKCRVFASPDTAIFNIKFSDVSPPKKMFILSLSFLVYILRPQLQ